MTVPTGSGLGVRFQHTAARRRLDGELICTSWAEAVSTHSRPKAAGRRKGKNGKTDTRFNTQPPEGGWFISSVAFCAFKGFNTQPPEGGW